MQPSFGEDAPGVRRVFQNRGKHEDLDEPSRYCGILHAVLSLTSRVSSNEPSNDVSQLSLWPMLMAPIPPYGVTKLFVDSGVPK